MDCQYQLSLKFNFDCIVPVVFGWEMWIFKPSHLNLFCQIAAHLETLEEKVQILLELKECALVVFRSSVHDPNEPVFCHTALLITLREQVTNE